MSTPFYPRILCLNLSSFIYTFTPYSPLFSTPVFHEQSFLPTQRSNLFLLRKHSFRPSTLYSSSPSASSPCYFSIILHFSFHILFIAYGNHAPSFIQIITSLTTPPFLLTIDPKNFKESTSSSISPFKFKSRLSRLSVFPHTIT